jgi:hypothetical protein
MSDRLATFGRRAKKFLETNGPEGESNAPQRSAFPSNPSKRDSIIPKVVLPNAYI